MVFTQAEETRLIEAARGGSETAFSAIYEAFQGPVRGAVFRLVSEETLDDIVQETFIRVHQKLGTFQGDSRLGTWIHRIAVNLALSEQRSGQSGRDRVTVSLDETVEGPGGDIYRLVEPGYEDRSFDEAEARRLLWTAAASLTAEDRDIVRLMVEGYGPTEVAEITGATVGAAKSSMFRVRTRLRESMQSLGRSRRGTERTPPTEALAEAAIA